MKVKINDKMPKVEKKRKQLVFFVGRQGEEVVDDLVKKLSIFYQTKKIEVGNPQPIDREINRADVLWFEHCDEKISYASKQQNSSAKLIVHIYDTDVFNPYIGEVDWDRVQVLVFDSETIKKIALDMYPQLPAEKMMVLSYGVDIDAMCFESRPKGFSIAYAGNINYEQGPMLLLQTFKRIYDRDSRYRLYMAGEFQEPRYVLYFQQMLGELGLEKNVVCEKAPKDMNRWLADKDFIISSGLVEGHVSAILKGMANGLKPLIHSSIGAREFFPQQYIWHSIGECEEMVFSGEYRREEYRNFVLQRYDLGRHIARTCQIIEQLV